MTTRGLWLAFDGRHRHKRPPSRVHQSEQGRRIDKVIFSRHKAREETADKLMAFVGVLPRNPHDFISDMSRAPVQYNNLHLMVSIIGSWGTALGTQTFSYRRHKC